MNNELTIRPLNKRLTAAVNSAIRLTRPKYWRGIDHGIGTKMGINKFSRIAVAVILASQFSFGQNYLSLDSSLQIAYENNRGLQSKSKQVLFYDQIKKSSSELPKADITYMVGQYNSYYKNDNNITVSQTIPFPTVFVAKSQLNHAQSSSAKLALSMSRNELTFEIRQLYLQNAYWFSYKKLLLSQDSILQQFVKATDLKYISGQSTLIDKTTVQTRLNEIRSKQSIVDAEITAINKKLQFLLGVNYQVNCAPKELSAIYTMTVPDTSILKNNPNVKFLEQQIEISEAERKLMNSSAFPEFKIGYFNQTLFGTPLSQNTMQLAGKSDRFQGFQLGLVVPLWFGPEISRNKAAILNTEVKSLEYENYLNNIQSEYEKLLIRIQSDKELINYFESSALPNAKLIEVQSSKSFELGDIEFTSHLLNLQQTIAIYEAYLNALNNYNANVLYLNFLLAE